MKLRKSFFCVFILVLGSSSFLDPSSFEGIAEKTREAIKTQKNAIIIENILEFFEAYRKKISLLLVSPPLKRAGFFPQRTLT